MPLDPKRVQAVFLSALECHDPAARAVVLDRECSTDTELRQRVEALLKAREEPNSLLDQPIVEPEHQLLATSDESSVDPSNLGGCIFPDDLEPAETLCSSDGDFAGTEADRTLYVRLPPEPPAFGERPAPSISGYEIQAELGRGGMGVVYRARQVHLNRPCALKMILAGAHADDQAS